MTTITYLLCDDGGFVARCDGCGITSYAYPTSVHAEKAKRRADKVALVMLDGDHTDVDRELREHTFIVEYDHRNNARLATPKAVKATGYDCRFLAPAGGA